MKKFIIVMLFFVLNICSMAQDKTIPYYEIPAHPETFTAGGVASRLVDGLGFRFYWATEGLRESDLQYKPGNDTRTSLETILHIYEMSVMIKNSTTQTINTPGQDSPLPFSEMRRKTLENLKIASDNLRKASDEDLKSFTIRFNRADKMIEYPFWNQLNGPIADCLWHVGQIVSLRRTSGNPFTEKVSLFAGTVLK
jgi:hypothetical protein